MHNCSPSHSIVKSLELFGIKNCKLAFFAVFLDCPETEMNLIKSKIAASSHGEIFDLNKHIEFLDVQKILSVFELRENEMTLPMPNAYQTCIYNRLALKDIK